MKKNVVMFSIVLFIGLFCSACNNTNEKQYYESLVDTPSITSYGKRTNGGKPIFWYAVDENTGVVYIEYNAYNAHGITVAFNADGTVMTKDQITRK